MTARTLDHTFIANKMFGTYIHTWNSLGQNSALNKNLFWVIPCIMIEIEKNFTLWPF